ncbi:OmpA family protein [Nitratifractor sp.]|uniref:OmpA family protein n=1 Tax=Nitratifractor sp. TaxID=2268144 RepID=UPI0025DE1E5A|nr:OmpA family protein [Nitratifractor sp.]
MNRSTPWIIILGAATALLLSGCSPKAPQPGNGNGNGSQYGTEVPGGISSTGKYTGQDGVSASGIKMIYFSSDRYDVEGDQLQRIMSDLPKIKRLAAAGKIRVEGNCDEMGTDEYNHALGLKRAKAVKSILVSNGIPASRIDVISYGESNPVCTGHSAPCHAKNRRAEINKVQ